MTLEGAKFICLDEAGNHGATVLAKGRKFTMGYYVSCDFVLSDERAKGIHCEIECDAHGRVTIRNLSSDKTILVNGSSVEIKRILLNNSKLSILDKEYLWLFPKTSSNEFEDLPDAASSTPQKKVGIPEQPPNSCPDFKLHRDLPKRFTVHNFAYCIQSDEEGNISSESNDENIEEDTEAQIENKNENRTEDDINLVEIKAHQNLSKSPEINTDTVKTTTATDLMQTPTMNLINCTQDKENKSTQKKNKELLTVCHQSDVVITSFSPRETGVKIEKSFATIIKPKVLVTRLPSTPKSVYSTPKGEISVNNQDDGNDRDLIAFHTPSTSKKGMRSPASIPTASSKVLKNSSMYLIDLTTPNKLKPASPYLKSALKASARKNLMQSTDKSCIKLFPDEQLDTSTLPVTPVESQVNSSSMESSHSVISVSSSTDISSVIDVTSDRSNTVNSTCLNTPIGAKTRTPKPTSQSLRKRAILTSTKKQNPAPLLTTPRREFINRIPLRSNLALLKTPVTPQTSIGNLSVSQLPRRESTSTPTRKSISANRRVNNSSTSNSNSASKMLSRRSSLNPISAAGALPTSTPVSGSNKNSAFKIRATCKTSPLRKVRKSLGGVPLSSHISKAKFTSIRQKSPQQVMSDRLVSRARNSLWNTTPVSARSRNMVTVEKTSYQSTCFSQGNQTVNNLSSTFIIHSDDEEENTGTKTQQQNTKNVTFTPEKETNSERRTIEIPVDVEEVTDSSKEVHVSEDKNNDSNEEKNTTVDECNTIEKQSNQLDNKENTTPLSNTDKVKSIVTEENFAEVVNDNQQQKNTEFLHSLNNTSPIESQERFTHPPDNDNMKDTTEHLFKASNQCKPKSNGADTGFGEESTVVISENKDKETYKKPENKLTNSSNNSTCGQTDITKIETNTQIVKERVLIAESEKDLQQKSSEYKPIVEDITLEGSLIEQESKENKEINVNKNDLNEGGNDFKENELKGKEINEEDRENMVNVSSILVTDQVGATTQDSESTKTLKQLDIDDEGYNKKTIQLSVIAQEKVMKLSDMESLETDRVAKDVEVNNESSETSQIPDIQSKISATYNAHEDTISKNLGETSNKMKPQLSEATQINEESFDKHVDEAATETSEDLDGTNKLLEEIEDVLNKSDEMKQKHLNELEECNCNSPNEECCQVQSHKHMINTVQNNQNQEQSEIVSNISKTENHTELNKIKEKLENATSLTPRRRSTRHASQPSDTPEASTFTPRRSTRRASMSSESTTTYTPLRTTTRRSSFSVVNETPLTPKRITKRRSSISIDDEAVKPRASTLQRAKTPRKQFDESMVIPEEIDQYVVAEYCQISTSSENITPSTPVKHAPRAKISQNMAVPEEMEEDASSETENINLAEDKKTSEIPINASEDLKNETKIIAFESLEKSVGNDVTSKEDDCVKKKYIEATTEVYSDAIEVSASFDHDQDHTDTAKLSNEILESADKQNRLLKEVAPKTVEEHDNIVERPHAFHKVEEIPGSLLESKCLETLLGDNAKISCADLAENLTVGEKTEISSMLDNRELLKTLKAEDCTLQPDGIPDLEHTHKEALAQEHENIEKSLVVAEPSVNTSKTPISQEFSTYKKAKVLSDSPKTPIMAGIRELLKTPKPEPQTPQLGELCGPIFTPKDSLKNDDEQIENIAVKKQVTFIAESPKTPLMTGMRELLKTPNDEMTTPKLAGIRSLLQTPKIKLENDEQEEIEKLAVMASLVKTPEDTKNNVNVISEMPSSSVKNYDLKGVKELLNTPKDCTTPHFVGVRELMQTPKVSSTPVTSGVKELVECSTSQETQNQETSTVYLVKDKEIPENENLKGVKELLKTPKSCSTPRFKGIKELILTPKRSSSPILSGIKELMDTSAQQNEKELEKFLRTPTAKNIMISSMPSSAIIEKGIESSIDEVSTEYDLNATNEGESGNLEDIFKTPVGSHFVERITSSYFDEEETEQEKTGNETLQDTLNKSAEDAFDKLVGLETQIQTPIRKKYSRKSFTLQTPQQQSPFSGADVLSDLPKSDVEEWIETLDEVETSEIIECDDSGEEEKDIVKHGSSVKMLKEVSLNEVDKQSTSLNESIIPETCTKVYLTEKSLAVKSTYTETKDPLTSRSLKENEAWMPLTSAEAEISGINLLDQTAESLQDELSMLDEPLVVEEPSIFDEALVVSDNESEAERTLNNADTHQVLHDEGNDLSEPLVVSDSEDLSQSNEEIAKGENKLETTQAKNNALQISKLDINVQEKSMLENVANIVDSVEQDPLETEDNEISIVLVEDDKTVFIDITDTSQTETDCENKVILQKDSESSLKEADSLSHENCCETEIRKNIEQESLKSQIRAQEFSATAKIENTVDETNATAYSTSEAHENVETFDSKKIIAEQSKILSEDIFEDTSERESSKSASEAQEVSAATIESIVVETDAVTHTTSEANKNVENSDSERIITEHTNVLSESEDIFADTSEQEGSKSASEAEEFSAAMIENIVVEADIAAHATSEANTNNENPDSKEIITEQTKVKSEAESADTSEQESSKSTSEAEELSAAMIENIVVEADVAAHATSEANKNNENPDSKEVIIEQTKVISEAESEDIFADASEQERSKSTSEAEEFSAETVENIVVEADVATDPTSEAKTNNENPDSKEIIIEQTKVISEAESEDIFGDTSVTEICEQTSVAIENDMCQNIFTDNTNIDESFADEASTISYKDPSDKTAEHNKENNILLNDEIIEIDCENSTNDIKTHTEKISDHGNDLDAKSHPPLHSNINEIQEETLATEYPSSSVSQELTQTDQINELKELTFQNQTQLGETSEENSCKTQLVETAVLKVDSLVEKAAETKPVETYETVLKDVREEIKSIEEVKKSVKTKPVETCETELENLHEEQIVINSGEKLDINKKDTETKPSQMKEIELKVTNTTEKEINKIKNITETAEEAEIYVSHGSVQSKISSNLTKSISELNVQENSATTLEASIKETAIDKPQQSPLEPVDDKTIDKIDCEKTTEPSEFEENIIQSLTTKHTEDIPDSNKLIERELKTISQCIELSSSSKDHKQLEIVEEVLPRELEKKVTCTEKSALPSSIKDILIKELPKTRSEATSSCLASSSEIVQYDFEVKVRDVDQPQENKQESSVNLYSRSRETANSKLNEGEATAIQLIQLPQEVKAENIFVEEKSLDASQKIINLEIKKSTINIMKTARVKRTLSESSQDSTYGEEMSTRSHRNRRKIVKTPIEEKLKELQEEKVDKEEEEPKGKRSIKDDENYTRSRIGGRRKVQKIPNETTLEEHEVVLLQQLFAQNPTTENKELLTTTKETQEIPENEESLEVKPHAQKYYVTETLNAESQNEETKSLEIQKQITLIEDLQPELQSENKVKTQEYLATTQDEEAPNEENNSSNSNERPNAKENQHKVAADIREVSNSTEESSTTARTVEIIKETEENLNKNQSPNLKQEESFALTEQQISEVSEPYEVPLSEVSLSNLSNQETSKREIVEDVIRCSKVEDTKAEATALQITQTTVSEVSQQDPEVAKKIQESATIAEKVIILKDNTKQQIEKRGRRKQAALESGKGSTLHEIDSTYAKSTRRKVQKAPVENQLEEMQNDKETTCNKSNEMNLGGEQISIESDKTHGTEQIEEVQEPIQKQFHHKTSVQSTILECESSRPRRGRRKIQKNPTDDIAQKERNDEENTSEPVTARSKKNEQETSNTSDAGTNKVPKIEQKMSVLEDSKQDAVTEPDELQLEIEKILKMEEESTTIRKGRRKAQASSKPEVTVTQPKTETKIQTSPAEDVTGTEEIFVDQTVQQIDEEPTTSRKGRRKIQGLTAEESRTETQPKTKSEMQISSETVKMREISTENKPVSKMDKEEPTTSRRVRRKVQDVKGEESSTESKSKIPITQLKEVKPAEISPVTSSEEQVVQKTDEKESVLRTATEEETTQKICEKKSEEVAKLVDSPTKKTGKRGRPARINVKEIQMENFDVIIPKNSEDSTTHEKRERRHNYQKLKEIDAIKLEEQAQASPRRGRPRKVDTEDAIIKDPNLEDDALTTSVGTRRGGRHKAEVPDTSKGPSINRKRKTPVEHSTEKQSDFEINAERATTLIKPEIPIVIEEPITSAEIVHGRDENLKSNKESELAAVEPFIDENRSDIKDIKRTHNKPDLSNIVSHELPTTKRVTHQMAEEIQKDIATKPLENTSRQPQENNIEKDIIEKPLKSTRRKVATKLEQHDKDTEQPSKSRRRRGGQEENEEHHLEDKIEKPKRSIDVGMLSEVKVTEVNLEPDESMNQQTTHEGNHPENLESLPTRRKRAAGHHIKHDRDESGPPTKRQAGRRKQVDEHESGEKGIERPSKRHSINKDKHEDNSSAVNEQILNKNKTESTFSDEPNIKDESTEATSKRRKISRKKQEHKEDLDKVIPEKDKKEEVPTNKKHDLDEVCTDHVITEDELPQEVTKKGRGRSRKNYHPQEVEQPTTSHNPELKHTSDIPRDSSADTQDHTKKEELQSGEELTRRNTSGTERQTPQRMAPVARKGRKAFEHITAESEEADDTPGKKARNIPQRKAATAYHNYDETSDSETSSKPKKKIDSPRKSIEAVKKLSSEVITSATIITVSASPSILASTTTARGRTRKPTAKVQQFLEEERAKAATPKKRALLAAAASTNTVTPQHTPARRGRKPSTIETDVEATPQASKSRGRGRPPASHVKDETTSVVPQITNVVEEEKEVEMLPSTIETDVESTPQTSKGRGRGRPPALHAKDETTIVVPQTANVVEERDIEMQATLLPENTAKGRRGGRKAKITEEDHHNNDEPSTKKSPSELESEKQSVSLSTEASPTRVAGRRNAAAAAKVRIEEDALAAAAIEPPKRARAKKATPKVSTPAIVNINTDVHSSSAEEEHSTKAETEVKEQLSSQKREHRIASATTIEGVEDIQNEMEEETNVKPTNKRGRKAATNTTTDSPAVPAKRGRKPKVLEEAVDSETSADSKTTRGRGKDRKNVLSDEHQDAAATTSSKQDALVNAEQAPVDTLETAKRGTRRRKQI